MNRTAISVVLACLCLGGSAWAQQESAKLIGGDSVDNDRFGACVAIEGDLAAIGALRTNGGTGAGYIFRRVGGVWSEEAKVIPSPDPAGSGFGIGAGISTSSYGDVAVFSAVFGINSGGGNTGTAFVYRKVGNAWIQETKLEPLASLGTIFYGFRAEVSGDLCIVSAPNESVQGNASGVVYVYRYNSSSWIEEAKLVGTDVVAFDQAGTEISISTSGGVERIMSGVPGHDAAGENSGAAYIFRNQGGVWIEEAELVPPVPFLEREFFGRDVEIRGDVAIVGASLENGEQGAAYIYRFDGADWVLEKRLTASDGEPGDRFGFSVGIDGDNAFVGAFRDDGNVGSAYYFQRHSLAGWQQVGKYTASDGEAGDQFADTLAVSGDFAIVGALTDTNERGVKAGAAYIFELIADTDGDGLPDKWEEEGYTHHNGEYVDLPAMGADPLHKDVFVQIDYMEGFRPGDASLEAIAAAFAAAPVDNPDGSTGITLHILVDDQLTHVSPLGTLDGGDYVWTRPDGSPVTHFDDLKAVHFAPELGWAVHYCLWADEIPGDFSGMSRGIEASDFIVSLGPFIEAAGGVVDPNWESGTFMHELGHNLGLRHGGGNDVSYKPNYLSVMNPGFQLDGLMFQEARGYWDYSFDRLPDLDESALDERVGIQGPASVDGFGTTWWMDGLPSFLAQQWTSAVNDPINWWRESVLGQEDVYELLGNPLDINDSPNGEIETLAGFDDWANLRFGGGTVGGGVVLPEKTPAEEQDLETAQSFAIAEVVTGLKGHDPNKMYTLTWNPIRPQSQMTEYRVYRDGTQIAATTNTNYKDQEITPGDTHVYWITWVNLLGQESVPGNKITISGN